MAARAARAMGSARGAKCRWADQISAGRSPSPATADARAKNALPRSDAPKLAKSTAKGSSKSPSRGGAREITSTASSPSRLAQGADLVAPVAADPTLVEDAGGEVERALHAGGMRTPGAARRRRKSPRECGAGARQPTPSSPAPWRDPTPDASVSPLRMKRALITGITGQDGSYLAELLLDEGLRGARRRPPLELLQHRAHRPPLPRSARARACGSSSTTAISTTPRRSSPSSARSRPDEVYNLGAQSHVRVSFDIPEYTGEVTGARHHPAPRGDPQARRPVPLLPGELERALRQGRRDAAARDDALPPAEPLRRGEGLRVLRHAELPRGVRHVRGQRHPLQPRERAPRRDVRHAQDHARRRAHQARPRSASSSSATSTRSATGATPPTTSRPCG